MRLFLALLATALGLAAFILESPARACTTAVVSREASATGRAMLWKNRDADGSDNQAVFLSDGKYPYVALVNRGDTTGLQIWAGINAAGFGIMNSASYNMEKGDTAGEGTFMKLALQTCQSVDDFEALLKRSNAGGRDVSANFGVVDARGGAASFETGKKSYVRFNAEAANDGARGLLVRSNYSRSLEKEAGAGYLREARGIELLGPLAVSKKLDARAILQTAARDITNVAIGSSGEAIGPPLVYTGDSICRLDTVATAVIEAPAEGELAETGVMWVIPALPIASTAIPVFPAAGSIPRELVASEEAAPAAAGTLALRTHLYKDMRGEKKRYMDRKALAGVRSEALPLLVAAENEAFGEVEKARQEWRIARPAAETVRALSEAAAARARRVSDAAAAAVIRGSSTR